MPDPHNAANDPWGCIRVFRRLDVGPVRIEPQRVITTYTLTTDEGLFSSDLVYRYERVVFDPMDPAARNLGSMITAQLALNYGLFADEIQFDGLFDDIDRQFLRDMAENTAREITVKKFLEHNPFLLEPAAHLPATKRDRYCRARLRFVDTVGKSSGRKEPVRPWSEDSSLHVVLSSGGKESLLTLGILREMGLSTYPIFINESGRHWLTALNGYRHLAVNHPGTGRVWTNSDRMFAWFLRHMPFVRRDFANVRSDEYPIRLWTVAVFLFGALPLLRLDGIGRISIGDEFDTSRRARHRGIHHYDGLYDQSRYFDRAMTRYFTKKGYRLEQFSLLRCMSEILVQKTLAERYPDLFEQQVSCHAAHVDGTRVRPCGKCEKCSRVVAMLLAFDLDPKGCGYTQSQVDDCLKRLASGTINQETEGAQHLAYLLNRKGMLPEGARGLPTPRARPEIMRLRFDAKRASWDELPTDLRTPVYRIMLEHAEGAVKLDGNAWLEFDPLASDRGSVIDTIQLGELTWQDAKDRFEVVDIALLPVGAIEQHGPHLPLDTDAFDAAHLAAQVAAACAPPHPVVLPLIPYGVSYHHDRFKGTIDVSPDSLSRMVHDIGLSAARNGVKKLVIINGHGGNIPALNFAAQLINRDARIFTCVDSGETSDADVYAIAETANDVHAGEIETSTALSVRPALVRMSKARKFVPKFSSQYLDFTSKRSVTWYARTHRISTSGVLGDPTKASSEKGDRIWSVMIGNLVELVEHLKSMSLDEIYQTRY